MKRKIKIKFLKELPIEKEVIIRDPEFVHIIEQNPHRIFKNKKAYTRKIKHKKDTIDD